MTDVTQRFRFHHLGVAVHDIERALPTYRDTFGYQVLSGPFDDPQQQATVCFLGSGEPNDNMVIELIAPLGEDSQVKRILAQGAGAYHVCYEVPDMAAVLADLKTRGWVVIRQPVPAVAFEGRPIAWLYSPTRQLIEFVEATRP